MALVVTNAQTLDFTTLREISRGSFYFFAKAILGYDWLTEHIHKPLCDALQELALCLKADPKTNEDLFNRLLCVIPRGWLKTTVCTIAFPIWLSAYSPNIRILLVQNSSTNACKKLSVIRGQWEQNSLLRGMFPELLPTKESVWRADSVCLTRSASWAESTYEAAGTSTRVVSRHYDVVIEDDTVAPDFDELGNESLAPTHEDVQKAIGWHRTNVLPLLNNPRCGICLVVGTRWYDQDLQRWIMDNEPQYRIITRSCRENAQGESDPSGEITYPERFNEKTLKELEVGLGSYMFYCLYLNMPIRKDKMAFQSEWFRYYDTSPQLSQLAIYTTVDPATDPELSKTGKVDYSVVMTCGKDMTDGTIYVLDYFHEQCNPGKLLQAIFEHVVRWDPILVGYEGIAFQRSIEYWAKEMMRVHGKFFILRQLPLSNSADAKNMRISGLQPIFEAHAVKLRTHMKELESELIKFPLGAHDDIADALSMQMVLWKLTKTLKHYKMADATANPLSFDSAVKEIKDRKSRGMVRRVVNRFIPTAGVR